MTADKVRAWWDALLDDVLEDGPAVAEIMRQWEADSAALSEYLALESEETSAFFAQLLDGVQR